MSVGQNILWIKLHRHREIVNRQGILLLDEVGILSTNVGKHIFRVDLDGFGVIPDGFLMAAQRSVIRLSQNSRPYL